MMAALPPEADIDQGSRDFRKWPEPDIHQGRSERGSLCVKLPPLGRR